MKTPPVLALVLFSLAAVPLHADDAEVRAGARVGAFANARHDFAGSLDLEVRYRGWSLAPAYEVVRGGYGLHAIHLDLRRLIQSERHTFWLGAGQTFAKATGGSKTTWNAEGGVAWRAGAWEPFVAARYYKLELPVFRDTIRENGAVLSVGVSRRLW